MGSLFSAPKAPTLTPVTAMPQPDDVELKKARQRQAGRSRARSGRASTALTTDAAPQTLGG